MTDRPDLRAKAYAIADEIETRALPLIKRGMARDKAIMLVAAQLSGHLVIARG